MAIQTYEIEAFVGNWCAWEYDIDAIQRDYVDGMNKKEFTELCEKHNVHKKAIKSINKAYETACYFMDDDKNADADEWFEKYENRIERYAKQLGIDYNKLEDDATEVRELGFDRC